MGLAIALGTRAPVLLLDEPLASLDPLARREFLHVLVEAVRETGATALLSSHVITDIEQACDRLLVLGGGRCLLDLSMEAARAGHRVVEGDGPFEAGRLVGRFPDPGWAAAGPRGGRLRAGPAGDAGGGGAGPPGGGTAVAGRDGGPRLDAEAAA